MVPHLDFLSDDGMNKKKKKKKSTCVVLRGLLPQLQLVSDVMTSAKQH